LTKGTSDNRSAYDDGSNSELVGLLLLYSFKNNKKLFCVKFLNKCKQIVTDIHDFS